MLRNQPDSGFGIPFSRRCFPLVSWHLPPAPVGFGFGWPYLTGFSVRHRTDRPHVEPYSPGPMPSFVIRYLEGFPDEIVADQYEEQDRVVVFTRDGEEVFRIRRADAVSIESREES